MRIGIDIIEIDRVRRLADREMNGTHRFYTEDEIAYCCNHGKQQYASFAGIFSAKEAFVKALGTGFRFGQWQEIEVCHDQWGAPSIVLQGTYREMAEQRQIGQIHLSISHSQAYAVAEIILEERL